MPHWVGEAMGGRLAEAGEPGHTAGAQLLPVSTGAGGVLRGAGAHHGAAPETQRYPYALSTPQCARGPWDLPYSSHMPGAHDGAPVLWIPWCPISARFPHPQ